MEITAGQLAVVAPVRDAAELLRGKRLSPRSSLRLVLPILAGTPRNAPTPAKAGLDSTSGTGQHSGVRYDYGSGHSLRAETAWLRAHGRLWRFVV
jgi:hypothetical protein